MLGEKIMKKNTKLTILGIVFAVTAITCSTVTSCIVSTNENTKSINHVKKQVTNQSNIKNNFMELMDGKNIYIKNNVFKNINISKYNNMFSNEQNNLKNNSILIYSTNNLKQEVKTNQEKKLESIFDSVLIHTKKYGLTSNYINSQFNKYHVTNQDYTKITSFINKSNILKEKIKNSINKPTMKYSNLFWVQSDACLSGETINFQNYFQNDFTPNYLQYQSTLYNVCIASWTAAAISSAAAAAYWAGGMVFWNYYSRCNCCISSSSCWSSKCCSIVRAI